MAATAAVAIIFTREDTAPSTFEAVTLGDVTIGDAVTEGIWPTATYTLTDLEPGDVVGSSCVGAALVDPTGGDDARIWIVDVSGALAPYLNIQIGQLTDAADVKPPGTSDPGNGFGTCTSNAPDYTVAVDGVPMSTVAADVNSWETGIPWLHADKTEARFRVVVDADAPVEEILGQTASITVAFENRPAS